MSAPQTAELQAVAAGVPARGQRVLASTHCVERYLSRRNALPRTYPDALAELRRIFARGMIVESPPDWVQCNRKNDFYLISGNNLVFPLAVCDNGDLLAVTCLDRQAADPHRLERRRMVV